MNDPAQRPLDPPGGDVVRGAGVALGVVLMVIGGVALVASVFSAGVILAIIPGRANSEVGVVVAGLGVTSIGMAFGAGFIAWGRSLRHRAQTDAVVTTTYLLQKQHERTLAAAHPAERQGPDDPTAR